MNLTKDTYEYLLNFADDKDILNMLSTNKKFRDEKFFERILKRRYPLLLKFKPKDESYKNFFISSIFYISKIQEIFGVPYIPAEGYDPKKFYKQMSSIYTPYNVLMSYATQTDNLNIINLLLKSVELDRALNSAIRNNNINIVKYFVEKGDVDIGQALFESAFHGYFDIVQYLAKKKVKKRDVYTAIEISEEKFPHIANYLRRYI